jgi:tripartite-type tricarboxylate transporter receptor subunit TctC
LIRITARTVRRRGRARHPGLPNVPTTAEAGLPGFELEAWVALFAPAGTPSAVVQTLTEKVQAATDGPLQPRNR